MIMEPTELDHAYRRVRELLAVTSSTESGQPILHMITKNRRSATLAIQVFVIITPSVTCVDISYEVAGILGLKYSHTHRGALINCLGSNAHWEITYRLGHKVYGTDVRDPLHYRSI
jgi:hypothetical protein